MDSDDAHSMNPDSSSDEAPDGDLKFCRCTPYCGKLLSGRQRRNHARIAEEITRRRFDSHRQSETEEESQELSQSTTSNLTRSDHGSPIDYEPGNAAQDKDAPIEYAYSQESEGRPEDTISIISSRPLSPSTSLAGDVPSPGLDSLTYEDNDDEWNVRDTLEDLAAQARQRIEERRAALSHELSDDILTEEDRDNIRAFNLLMRSTLTSESFKQMRWAFRHKMELDSEWVILHRLAMLSGVAPVWYDCCINACCCFVGDEYADLETCPYCQERRYSANRKARKVFCYLPLVPRLQSLFRNQRSIEILKYRSEYKSEQGIIRDVFDSRNYKDLRKTKVVVDGTQQPHCYFSGTHDIALSLSADGFLIFGKKRMGGPSAIPVVIQNLNLPPEIRSLLNNLICVGVIPGPSQPKDFRSFLYPLEEELVQLAQGVDTYNAVTGSLFKLFAYLLLFLGDILAVEKMLGLKGHNGFAPCRNCNIKGFRNKSGGGTVYYSPLSYPHGSDKGDKSWNPQNLPLRKHADFLDIPAQLFDPELSLTDKKKLSQYHGIRHAPLIQRVASLDFSKSFPWDGMHLFFLNICPNLVLLWTGKYKGLDQGSEEYELGDGVWTQVGEETADAVKYIPAKFVSSLANIASSKSWYTAETWAFWFMYIAPIVLHGRFKRNKYYQHLLILVKIMQRSMQFQITHGKLEELHTWIIDWVTKYERYYYQRRESRLCACNLPMHGLLHIPDDFRNCGPLCNTWTFFNERFIGQLQSGIKSRVHPWGNLHQQCYKMAILSQLGNLYSLEDELSTGPKPGELSKTETVYPEYPDTILRSPSDSNYTPDEDLRRKIAEYFRSSLGGNERTIRSQLPAKMTSWAKVRIKEGDFIRSKAALTNMTASTRDNSYVRYEYPVTKGRQEYVMTGYGCLQQIIACQLPATTFWNSTKTKMFLLGLVEPCNTEGKDATEEVVFYETTRATRIINLLNISSVVGRVKTGKKWGIIDRSKGVARTDFVDDEDEDEDV